MIIRNTPWNNLYGGGKQQEVIDEKTGKKYILRNTPWDNLHGPGKQQELIEVGNIYDEPNPEDVKDGAALQKYGVIFLLSIFILGMHKFTTAWWILTIGTIIFAVYTVISNLKVFGEVIRMILAVATVIGICILIGYSAMI